ncbi:MAG: hypothetical protein A7316_10410 [Candidatus Altiarchaeales archaeon WOR_SM1_86-2]|nr:MAG: hypothetical protein A7316_10410 [Candidatus Altiarchaeales archaeon WOR_SM1_86-2]ODS38010.1 MAG: hypothetical protein A7315_12925 [Candidatus Altiarchaeales archaeon WOR_SM1_79]
MASIKKKLMGKVRRGEKITKREFYAYETTFAVMEGIRYFFHYYRIEENEMVCDVVDPIAEMVSEIKSERALGGEIKGYILDQDIGLSRREAKNLAVEITDEVLEHRKHCKGCPGNCLFDPDGDATQMFASMENLPFHTQKEEFEDEYDKEFEDDIVRLDKLLNDRRRAMASNLKHIK